MQPARHIIDSAKPTRSQHPRHRRATALRYDVRCVRVVIRRNATMVSTMIGNRLDLADGFTKGKSPSMASDAQGGIEFLPQPVAKEVGPEHREEDRKAWDG